MSLIHWEDLIPDIKGISKKECTKAVEENCNNRKALLVLGIPTTFRIGKFNIFTLTYRQNAHCRLRYYVEKAKTTTLRPIQQAVVDVLSGFVNKYKKIYFTGNRGINVRDIGTIKEVKDIVWKDRKSE